MSAPVAVVRIEVDLHGAMLMRQALDRELRVLGVGFDQNGLRDVVAELDRVIADLQARAAAPPTRVAGDHTSEGSGA